MIVSTKGATITPFINRFIISLVDSAYTFAP